MHKSLRTSLPTDLHHRCAREHTNTTSLTDCHHVMYHIAFKFQHKWKTNFATMWSSTKVQSEACRVLTRRSPHSEVATGTCSATRCSPLSLHAFSSENEMLESKRPHGQSKRPVFLNLLHTLQHD